jgi:hypothetical protein
MKKMKKESKHVFWHYDHRIELEISTRTYVQILRFMITRYPLKGGDPAPGSPRATLLRLHPSHRSDRRRSPQKLGPRLQVRTTPMV